MASSRPTTIHRSARRERFTTVNNDLIEDGRLSFEAVGLLIYLLSKPDDWTVTFADLCRRDQCKEYKVRRIMVEIQAAGYATLEIVRGEHGVLAGRRYVISEDPAEVGFAPKLEKTRRREKPDVRKTPKVAKTPPILNTDPLPSTEKAPKTEGSGGVARKTTSRRAGATGPVAEVGRALARIRGLNPDVCAESDRQPLRDLAEIIVGAGVEDPATVDAWGRQWYASMAKRLQKPVAEIGPPTVGQLKTFVGIRLPRKADPSAPTVLDEDAIRERWPGLTFIAPNGRLSVKSPHALACEGKVERDSYDYLDRSTWPADVRECVAAVAALHGQAVHA